MFVEKPFSTCHISPQSLGSSHPIRNPMNVENPSTIHHSSLHTKEDTWGHLHECCLCTDKPPCPPENSKLRNPMTVNTVENISTISHLLLYMKEVT